MNKMIKYCLFLFAATLFCSCNSDTVKQIDREQVTIYYNKIKSLSKESLPYSDANRVRNLESYKDSSDFFLDSL
jgi:hypothetical protein